MNSVTESFSVLLILALAICISTHLLSIAAFGYGLGITIREIALGFGPKLKIGNYFRVGLLPFGGYVRFADANDESAPELNRAKTLLGKSMIEQLGVALIGPVMLLLIAWFCLGSQAVEAFLSAPAQLVSGALAPMSGAQLLLRSAHELLQSPLATTLGTVAAKFAAVNLLPLTGLNGGAALAAIGRATGLAQFWPESASIALVFVLVIVWLMWLIAICVFFIR